MTLPYNQQKEYAAAADAAKRLLVAQNHGTIPELLYYLAKDSDSTVRMAVLQNPMMPQHAYLVLAKDKNPAIREAVAQKLSSFILAEEAAKAKSLGGGVLAALDVLVLDPLDDIRIKLAEAFKFSLLVPKKVLQALARDAVAAVSRPVLENSPQFVEADFVELLSDSPPTHITQAIARRKDLSAKIIDAVLVQDDAEAADVLLLNNAIDLSSYARERATALTTGRNAAMDAVLLLHQAGGLDDAAVYSKVMQQDRPWVLAAIAILSGMRIETVKKVAQSRSAHALTALCWKAGLTAVTAYQVQLKIAHIVPMNAVPPQKGGYSLSDKQLQWHVDIVAGLDGGVMRVAV